MYGHITKIYRWWKETVTAVCLFCFEILILRKLQRNCILHDEWYSFTPCKNWDSSELNQLISVIEWENMLLPLKMENGKKRNNFNEYLPLVSEFFFLLRLKSSYGIPFFLNKKVHLLTSQFMIQNVQNTFVGENPESSNLHFLIWSFWML